MTPEQAATIALHVLAHLASDELALGRFQALTGVDGAQLHAQADDPTVLAGVLDFYLRNEWQLLEMCDAIELDPTLPALAHGQLVAMTDDDAS